MKKYLLKFSYFIIAAIFSSFIIAPTALADAGYTWTDVTGTPIGPLPWSGVASSSSGQYLAAVAQSGNDIYTSSDYGQTWIDEGNPGPWQDIASSSSGQYLTAVQSSGTIESSSDYGHTWTPDLSGTDPNYTADWYSIALSSTGQDQYAVDLEGTLYFSNDYGNSWTDYSSNLPESNQLFYSVATSSTGQYVAAAVLSGPIFLSNDYGQSWTTATAPTNGNWFEVSMSADGSHLAGANASGDIWTSSDYGADWTDQTNSTNEDWWAVGESANGQVLVAGAWYGDVFTSIDGGVTWTDQGSTTPGSHGWYAVSMSADGSRVIIADGEGYGRYNGSGGDLWVGYDPSLVAAPTNTNSQSLSTPSVGNTTSPSSPNTGYGSPNKLSPLLTLSIITGLVTLALGLGIYAKKRTKQLKKNSY